MFALRTAQRLTRGLTQVRSASTAQAAAPNQWFKVAAGFTGLTVVGTGSALAYSELLPLVAEEEQVHVPHYHWPHSGAADTFDHASIRRGYEVYRQVCAACHSMDLIAFRNLVGTVYSEEDAKLIASEATVTNGEPNDDGDMFKRQAKLFDYFPAPYENEQQSRKANAGALPPDLSVIVKARHGNEDYIFSLLTGYCDPPAGITVAEGQNFNPYFAGSKIGMAAPLYDEIIEYEDGTPATTSQLAKDVATFLAWSAEPEHDERKRMGVKAMFVLSLLLGLSLYMKRHKWSALKSRQVVFKKNAKW